MTSSRHRILYPAGNITSNRNLTVDHNVTVDCIADCIGVCVYSICFPSTPISPTPLPYGDVSGNETTPINLHSRNRVLPTLIITATACVVGSFFLLLAFYAYLRLRHGRRRRRRILATDGEAAIIEDDDDLIQGGEEVEHHIWYIRTQGLDENTISSIPSLVYRSGDVLVDGRDCSVCLGEFRDGELARLLPTCRHAFHLPCIDRWLRSHVNCPLCRSPIVPPVDTPVSEPSFISPNNTVNSGQVWTENGPSVLAENTEIETLTCEGNTQGKDIITEIQLSEGSSSRASTSELPDSSPKDGQSLQPIRRSVSMDSFSLDDPVKGGRKEGEFVQQQGYEYASENGEKSMGYLKDNLILELKYPAQMERSLSSQSARWFFTRYGRSRNSVLPL